MSSPKSVIPTSKFELTPGKTIKITWELEKNMPGISVMAKWEGGSHRHMFNMEDAEGYGLTPIEYATQNQNWVIREAILPKLVRQFNIDPKEIGLLNA